MLRLFPDEIGVYLSPFRVAIARYGRGLGAKARFEKVADLPAAADGGWGAALEFVAAELTGERVGRPVVRFIISDHWARYELLPWSIDITREAERIEHARYLMASTYGDLIDSWSLALSDAAPGATRIVSAVPSELLAQLNEIGRLSGLKVVSVQPRLIASFNRWRQQLPQAATWFATIEEGSLAALHLTDGSCDRIRSVRLSDDWCVELDRIKTLGRLARNRPIDGPVYVDAPKRIREMAESSSSEVHWLTGGPASKSTLARVSALVEEAA